MLGGDSSFGQHEAQLPLRADCRDQVGAEPRAGAGNHRRSPASSPGGAAGEVRAHPSFIGKEDLCSRALRTASDRRIVRLQPLLHRFGVLLIRLPQRALRGQAKLMRQPAHRTVA
jgi:hypothetical protein